MGKAKLSDGSAAPAASDDPKGRDVALVHGATEDGKGARILRLKDGELSAGEVRPAREGQALDGHELIRLRSRPDRPALCDVEVLHDGRAPAAKKRSAGPARVASEAYRRGWGQVFKGTPSSRNSDRALN